MPDQTILTVKDLAVRLDDAPVFEHLSFEIKRGEVAAIIGPNGGGKTTLLKCLLGLIPYNGKVRWHGSPRLGYVPQRFSIDRNFPLLGREFLELVSGRKLKYAALPESLIHEPALLGQRIGGFSAGELQRFLIAAALLRDPQILLLDEPTADLDVVGGESVSRHIFHLAKERNLAVLLVSHDLQLVYGEVDQVLCLNRRMVCFGPPRTALTAANLKELYGGEVSLYHHSDS